MKRRARLRSVKPWALCNSVSKSTLELGQRKLLAHLNPAKNTSRSHALDIWARVLAGGRTSRAARRCSGWTGARSGRPSPPSRRPPRLRRSSPLGQQAVPRHQNSTRTQVAILVRKTAQECGIALPHACASLCSYQGLHLKPVAAAAENKHPREEICLSQSCRPVVRGAK